MGAVNVLQSVMIADCIDYEEYVNPKGIRPDGVFFSGQSFATKLASGIASILSAVVYAYVGYSDENVAMMTNALNNGANFKVDYEPYATAMIFLCSIPPAIGLLLAVIPTLKYALSDKEHSRILEELKVRRAQREIGNADGENAEEVQDSVSEVENNKTE